MTGGTESLRPAAERWSASRRGDPVPDTFEARQVDRPRVAAVRISPPAG
jgi:hypothetical protein